MNVHSQCLMLRTTSSEGRVRDWHFWAASSEPPGLADGQLNEARCSDNRIFTHIYRCSLFKAAENFIQLFRRILLHFRRPLTATRQAAVRHFQRAALPLS